MASEIRIDDFPLKDETDLIIGRAYDIYRQLGFGFSEIVYKDAFEYEFGTSNILFEREKEYPVKYKDAILRHKFYADFVVSEKVILEIKAKEAIANEDYSQTINT